MAKYLENIWKSRYFWTHLALADLRSKWRRSFFGILWSIIQPVGLTILIAIVFGKIFKTDIGTYAPYILSGIIVWDYMSSTAVSGSLAFVQADAYIKQSRHPLAIYTLRPALANLIVMAMASLSLIGWVLIILPENFGLCWLAALLIFPIVGSICWPMATCLAYIGTRFRDLPHALGLICRRCGLYRRSILMPRYSGTAVYMPWSTTTRSIMFCKLSERRCCRVNGQPRKILLTARLPASLHPSWLGKLDAGPKRKSSSTYERKSHIVDRRQPSLLGDRL